MWTVANIEISTEILLGAVSAVVGTLAATVAVLFKIVKGYYDKTIARLEADLEASRALNDQLIQDVYNTKNRPNVDKNDTAN